MENASHRDIAAEQLENILDAVDFCFFRHHETTDNTLRVPLQQKSTSIVLRFKT